MTLFRYHLHISYRLVFIIWLLSAITIPWAPVAHSHESVSADEQKQTLTTISQDTIKRKLDALESDTSLDKETRSTLESLYRKAIANLESISAHENAILGFTSAQKEAPEQTRALRQKSIEIQKASPLLSLQNSADEKLEALLLKEKANLASVEAKLTKASESLKYHTERPQIIRQRLIEANREANGIANRLQQAAVAGY